MTYFFLTVDALGVDSESVYHAIQALSHILLECTRKQLNEEDFLTSCDELKLSSENKTILNQFYMTNHTEIRSILSELSLHLEHYHNIDWRLDITLASRAMRHQMKPNFLLELQTKDAEDGKFILIYTPHSNNCTRSCLIVLPIG